MSTALIENLYTEELYQIPGKVVIVLSKSWADILPEHQVQLSKILAALKLNLNTVQIINWSSLDAILSLSPSKVISFGVVLKPDSNFYEALTHQGISLIQADTLDQLDDVKKRNLWLSLKTMFGI